MVKYDVTENDGIINDIVEIHMKTFKGFFLTFLGKGFLKNLYWGFMKHRESGIVVAIDGKKIVGFCAYSSNLSNFYKFILRKRLFHFAWYAVGAFIRRPSILLRLLRAFKRSEESKSEDEYIELSSIGVEPQCKNMGIGSGLIDKLVEISKSTTCRYIKLETDKKNNEVANLFYIKNGFVLERSYFTPEGREMNEYRFYLE